MKVRCIANQATNEQVKNYEVQRAAECKHNVTPGREYLVLALTALASNSAHGTGVTIDVLDDSGRWSMQPLFLFEMIDPRPSRYWIAKKMGEAELALWPVSFFQDCYHDHLTNGRPEEVADFKQVCARLEAEFAEDDGAVD